VRAAAAELRKTVERRLVEADEQDRTNEKRRGEFLAALTLFENEFSKPYPDLIVMRGMMAYMREVALPSWEQPLAQLNRNWQAP
jgi:hypothetical protein